MGNEFLVNMTPTKPPNCTKYFRELSELAIMLLRCPNRQRFQSQPASHLKSQKIFESLRFQLRSLPCFPQISRRFWLRFRWRSFKLLRLELLRLLFAIWASKIMTGERYLKFQIQTPVSLEGRKVHQDYRKNPPNVTDADLDWIPQNCILQ